MYREQTQKESENYLGDLLREYKMDRVAIQALKLKENLTINIGE